MKIINKQTVTAALIGGVSALFLAMGGVALAHGGGHGHRAKQFTPEKIDEHVTEMTERLDLSAAQAEQVRALLELFGFRVGGG